MIDAILSTSFLKNAITASLLASVICGIIGVIVVEKKLTMMSGGIAHTAYGGVGLGYLLGFEPLIGAAIFSVGAALGVGALRRRGGANSDIIISLFWALGMALGIAFVGFMPGYPPDLNSYLFGNILSVMRRDLIIMSVLCAGLLIFTVVFFSDIKAFLFDDAFSSIIGIPVRFFEYAILIMIALSVVVLIRIVGIILVIALLSAPAACAALVSKKFSVRMIVSALFSLFFCIGGLVISYELELASGATIIFLSVITYGILLLYNRISELFYRKVR